MESDTETAHFSICVELHPSVLTKEVRASGSSLEIDVDMLLEFSF